MRRSVLLLAAALFAAAPLTAVYSESAPPPAGTKKPAAKKAAPLAENQYASESEAKTRCGADAVVWMNFSSKVYHAAGTRDYGKTRRGAYMCRTDADKSGRPVKGGGKAKPKPKPKD